MNYSAHVIRAANPKATIRFDAYILESCTMASVITKLTRRQEKNLSDYWLASSRDQTSNSSN